MNIYVGDDLRKRMRKVKESTNWSSVACQAFEAHLGEIASRKQEKTMDDVIQRLRASKAEDSSEEERAGRAAGERWAKHTASYAELRKFGALSEQIEGAQSSFSAFFPDHASFSLYGATFGEESAGTRMELARAAESWWGQVAYEKEPTDDFVFGFFEAAVGVLNEVESKL